MTVKNFKNLINNISSVYDNASIQVGDWISDSGKDITGILFHYSNEGEVKIVILE